MAILLYDISDMSHLRTAKQGQSSCLAFKEPGGERVTGTCKLEGGLRTQESGDHVVAQREFPEALPLSGVGGWGRPL